MSHVVFSLDKGDIHDRTHFSRAHYIVARNIFLMLRNHFKDRERKKEWKEIWEQWRWDIEAVDYIGLYEGLDDPQFRQNFMEALNKTTAFVDSFGGEIDPKTLNELDDIWEFEYTKGFNTNPISKCLAEIEAAIKDHYKLDAKG